MSHSDQPYELESQFIMRVPEVPASVLREALKSGNLNLKDRMKLKLEPDLRHGTMFLDHFVLPSKVVDVPCIIETFKSIDKKVVYKTADVCQMLICMEEEEPPEEEPKTQKKKDSNKVDKKYLYPHGITPPLKNVRKRRFRKTLKKKQYLDQPEIEKEVRRLLRADYEAHHVSWEVIDEEDHTSKDGGTKDILMQGSKTNEEPTSGGNSRRIAVELFGDALSDSEGDDDETGLDRRDLEDDSRISEEDESSRMSQSDSVSCSQSQDTPKERKSSYVTSFSKDMFASPGPGPSTLPQPRSRSPQKTPRHRNSSSSDLASLSKDDLHSQLTGLKNQLTEISARRQIQETELSTTDNAALKNRLETVLHKLANDQMQKEREIREIEMLLNQ